MDAPTTADVLTQATEETLIRLLNHPDSKRKWSMSDLSIVTICDGMPYAGLKWGLQDVGAVYNNFNL